MIMQTISLHDVIVIKKTPAEIIVDTSDASLASDRGNLAYQAAELMLTRFNIAGGVDIFIDKKIPIAAGLAGGSTDAAAVLKGIDKLYELDLPDRELQEIAAEIGSDVPFCLRGGTALATGRGTDLKQLPDIEKQQLVIVCPSVKISTAEVYNDYDQLRSRKEFKEIPTSKLLEHIKSGEKIKWDEGWNNILETVTIHKCREINEIKKILYKNGAKFCLMSGSGPAVYAVMANKTISESMVNNWPRQSDVIFTVCTVRKDFLELWK